MKKTLIIPALVVALSPLFAFADDVVISTRILTLRNSDEIPRQAKTISSAEWMKLNRTLAQKRGVEFFQCPSITTSFGKTVHANVKSVAPDGAGPEYKVPHPPVSRIGFTPIEHNEGIELRGEIKLFADAAFDRGGRSPVSLAGNVQGIVHRGDVLICSLGEHIIGITITESPDKKQKPQR